jgi:hypothetical protein
MERRSGAVNKNCQKLTRELTSLKNNKAKASKKSKDSEKRCLKDDAIDNCACEHLREKFVLEEYQQQHTMITAQSSRRQSKAIQRPFFWICRLNVFGYVDDLKWCSGCGYADCYSKGPGFKLRVSHDHFQKALD